MVIQGALDCQKESRECGKGNWSVYCDAMVDKRISRIIVNISLINRALQGSESNISLERRERYCCYHCSLRCDSTSKAIIQLKRPTFKPGFLTETSKALYTVQVSRIHPLLFSYPNLRAHRPLARRVLLLMPKPPAATSLGFPFPGVPLPFTFPSPTPIFTSTLSLHAFTVSSS